MVWSSTAGGWYGVPCRTIIPADWVMTLTSGWPWFVQAIQASGTITAPARLSARARSVPRDRQAMTTRAAAAYPQAAMMPHNRCR